MDDKDLNTEGLSSELFSPLPCSSVVQIPWENTDLTALLEGFHRSAGNRYKVEPVFQISGIL